MGPRSHGETSPENDLRAHRITLTSSRLARRLDRLVHGRDAAQCQRESLEQPACNANWFHFAAWANRTVTHNIGIERTPQLSAGPATPLRRRLTPAMLQPQASKGRHVRASAVAWGQRLIFVATCLTLLEFDGHRGTFRTRSPVSEQARRVIDLTTWGDRAQWFSTTRHFLPISHAFELYTLASGRRGHQPRERSSFSAATCCSWRSARDLDRPALRTVMDQVPQRVTDAVDWPISQKLVEEPDVEASRRSSRTPCCGRVTESLSADSSTPCGLGSSLRPGLRACASDRDTSRRS